MLFITQGKTNLKYILIVVVLAAIVGGGILGYYYWWIKDLETRLIELELRLSEKVPEVLPGVYKSEKYGFEINLPVGWHKTTILQDWVAANYGYNLEGEVFTPLTTKEEQQRLKDLLDIIDAEFGFEISPSFCNLRYAEEKQFIVTPFYLKDLKAYRNFKDYIDKNSVFLITGETVITNFQEIEHPTISPVYQYHEGWGFEGCTEWGMRTYFPYPAPRIIEGEEIAGLLLEMEETPDGRFNTELYDQLVASFKFLE